MSLFIGYLTIMLLTGCIVIAVHILTVFAIMIRREIRIRKRIKKFDGILKLIRTEHQKNQKIRRP